MSYRVKKEKKEKKENSDYIQEFIPKDVYPTSWTKDGWKLHTHLQERHWITEWRDEKGRLYQYTQRWQEDGSFDKEYFVYTYWKHKEASEGFCQAKGWQGQKCLYNSHKILETDKPILLGEGESVLQFALHNEFLSKHYLPTAFYGGVENWRDFNWDVLKHKKVILCPDNDDPGKRCMYRIAYYLKSKEITENVHYLKFAETFPGKFPAGWDIADPFPKDYPIEEVLKPNSMFINTWEKSLDETLAKEIEKEVIEEEKKSVAKGLMSSYCYVMGNDLFNKLGSDDFYNKAQLNNYYADKKTKISDQWLKDKDFAKAEIFITHAGFPPGVIEVKRGDVPLINEGRALNIYTPNNLTATKGDISIIDDYYVWLIGQDKWSVIKQWIAFHLQNPGRKCKWAIVLVSAIEGTGKGLLARIISRLLGEKNVNENANYKHLTNTHNTLLVGKQVVVLNEISLGDFKSKREGTNSLKNFIADDTYTCNFKGKPMQTLANLTNFMLFSNDTAVLSVSNGSRRYFFVNIQKTEEEIVEKSDDGTFEKMWNFVDSDEGASALLHHFKNEIQVDYKKMKERAPVTDDLKELIEQSKHPVIKKLEYDLYENKKHIFDHKFSGVMSFNQLKEHLDTQETGQFTQEKYNWGSYGDDALYKFLEANSTPWNDGSLTRQINVDGVRSRYYLLDDSKCPMPGKSYKDLTPKQIANCATSYSTIVNAIHTEKKELEEAQEKFPFLKQEVERHLDSFVSDKKKNTYGETREEVYKKWHNGSPPTIPLYQGGEDIFGKYKNYARIIKRGSRPIEEILNDPLAFNTHKDPF